MIKIYRESTSEWKIKGMTSQGISWIADLMGVLQRVSGVRTPGVYPGELPLAERVVPTPAPQVHKPDVLILDVLPGKDS